MSNNAQKTPLGLSLNRLATKRVLDAFQVAGQALPCSVTAVNNSIVTVKFEILSGFTLPSVTIPLVGAEYIRYPTQVGDKGVVFAADARLAGVSGIGGGVADLSTPANLTALVFLPVGNMNWTATPDPQSVVLYGPNGVRLQDTGASSTVVLTPSGIAMTTDELTITATTAHHGDVTITGSVTINGPLHVTDASQLDGNVTAGANVTTLTGDVTAGTISLKTHLTSGVTSGILISGPPVP